MKKNKQGFTLIEIIFAITMILIMTAVLIGGIIGVIRRGEERKINDIKVAIVSGAKQYFVENGQCPSGLNQLIKNNNISKKLIEDYEIDFKDSKTWADCEDLTEKDIIVWKKDTVKPNIPDNEPEPEPEVPAQPVEGIRYIVWEKSNCSWYDWEDDASDNSCTMTGIKAFVGTDSIINFTKGASLNVYHSNTTAALAWQVNSVKNGINNFNYSGPDLNAKAWYEVDLGAPYELTSIQYIKGWDSNTNNIDAANLVIKVMNADKSKSKTVVNVTYNNLGGMQKPTVNLSSPYFP